MLRQGHNARSAVTTTYVRYPITFLTLMLPKVFSGFAPNMKPVLWLSQLIKCGFSLRYFDVCHDVKSFFANP